MLTRIVLVSGKSNLSSVYQKNFNVKEIVFPSKLKGLVSFPEYLPVGVGCIDIRSSSHYYQTLFLVKVHKTPQPDSVILKHTAPFLALTALE